MFFSYRLLSCYTLWQAKAVIVSHKMKLALKSVNAETPCARCLISDGGVNHSSVWKRKLSPISLLGNRAGNTRLKCHMHERRKASQFFVFLFHANILHISNTNNTKCQIDRVDRNVVGIPYFLRSENKKAEVPARTRTCPSISRVQPFFLVWTN